MSAADFELLGPLPSGRVAIEASAGTGKTYALSALATRYLVEAGTAPSELLVVTFTRAAAAELRDRVRDRLARTARALEAATRLGGGAEPDDPDELVRHLCAHDPHLRLSRARAALAEFDATTITTIHGFASQVLGTLGTTSPTDPDAVLVDDRGALVRQVAADELVRDALVDPDGPPLPSVDRLGRVVETLATNPGALVVPDADPEAVGEAAARQRLLVDRVGAGADHRRRHGGRLAYDDVLLRLRDALADPHHGAGARATLSRRYPVVLIDEFQDTDPVQWEIFSILAERPAPGGALVLVGDPKQAIYVFRGADVHTYLEAVEAPGTERATLATNWRSDGAVLDSLAVLLRGATFGDPRIGFRDVQACAPRATARLLDEEGRARPALELRLATHPDLPRPRKNGTVGPPAVDDAAEAIWADLAGRVRDLLETAHIPDDHPTAAEGATRSLTPRDVAVLVGTNSQAPEARDALRRVGIPAVISRGDPVLEAPAAHHLRILLEALLRPADPRRARALCLSWFEGWTPAEVVAAGEEELAPVHERLHRWSELLVVHGVHELVRVVWAEARLAERLLGTLEGDRAMTDLDHLVELLADAAPPRTGPAGLLAAFDRLDEATAVVDGDAPDDVAARRIESEADAVQIMTVYAAKGLEFPVVCTPMAWRGGRAADVVVFRDPATGRRTVDAASGVAWPDTKATTARKDQAKREALGHGLRLLYVALTRARHANLVWWSDSSGAEASALGHVLFCRDEAGTIDPERFDRAKATLPEADATVEALAPMVGAHAGLVEVGVVEPPPAEPRRWSGRTPATTGPLEVARIERTFDRTRRRHSFTSLTARDHGTRPDPADPSLGDAGAADEAGDEGPGGAHGLQPDHAAATGATPGEPSTVDGEGAPPLPLPLGGVRGGTVFGTLVHGVLEHADFTAADLAAEVGGHVDDALAATPWPVGRDVLVEGLCAALTTPLGPLADHRALADIGRGDRLDELDFHLLVGQGGTPVDDAAIGAAIADHLPAGDPLAPWARSLATGRFGALLAGQLVGSVDAVLRVRRPEGDDRFLVVDYKTNDLRRRGAEVATLADYHPARLPAAMAAHHYPLQALLYQVALHRYLRWRLADYRPEDHLGGIAYLFVRGMVGPDTPAVEGTPHGVFAWRPPHELVATLSDLLDGSAP